MSTNCTNPASRYRQINYGYTGNLSNTVFFYLICLLHIDNDSRLNVFDVQRVGNDESFIQYIHAVTYTITRRWN